MGPVGITLGRLSSRRPVPRGCFRNVDRRSRPVSSVCASSIRAWNLGNNSHTSTSVITIPAPTPITSGTGRPRAQWTKSTTSPPAKARWPALPMLMIRPKIVKIARTVHKARAASTHFGVEDPDQNHERSQREQQAVVEVGHGRRRIPGVGVSESKQSHENADREQDRCTRCELEGGHGVTPINRRDRTRQHRDEQQIPVLREISQTGSGIGGPDQRYDIQSKEKEDREGQSVAPEAAGTDAEPAAEEPQDENRRCCHGHPRAIEGERGGEHESQPTEIALEFRFRFGGIRRRRHQ